jgi:translocation protein SEC63
VELSYTRVVIGERLVTPSSIVFFVVKLRLSPPQDPSVIEPTKEEDVDEVKRRIKRNEEKDAEFLTNRKDAEEIPENAAIGWAHAPYWPKVSEIERK